MTRSSPLALVVLALLAEEPMHPYRMQQMIKERGKDKIANVAQRNSVYQTIERLLRAELIGVRETTREERRPERTVYEITDEGWATLRSWTRSMLSAPRREFPEFPAALTSVMLLEPVDVLAQLDSRAEALRAEIEVSRAEYEAMGDLPRLFLLDDEYLVTMRESELRWVEGVAADLRAGRLTWSEEWIRDVAATIEG
ncbi:PadR family transcriptional regulator [Actinophytocola xanthii]|uniref:PadR family transcriptional regulator n=1 Tax=Actinophytocola xanthii TaxID=1912961 RepID=A0A1Q8CSN2_9PSEU|nr:PadR family transcriptional regulator [Actinophytocola xanthii]OLF17378.1 PadR family transcriptional regulator [Actinophytocola xanthii]